MVDSIQPTHSDKDDGEFGLDRPVPTTSNAAEDSAKATGLPLPAPAPKAKTDRAMGGWGGWGIGQDDHPSRGGFGATGGGC